MTLTEQLTRIVKEHGASLPEYAWASEHDRWTELIFCVISRVRSDELESTRTAVDLLSLLGLLDVSVLSNLNGEDASIVKRVLRAQGFTAAQAEQAIAVMKAVAARTRSAYRGKMQRVLRKHAERLRDELTKTFQKCGLKQSDVQYAVSEWLQNAASLPVSLETAAIKDFCKTNRVRLSQLLDAADSLDLNVALVDDVIGIAQDAKRR